MTQSKATRSIIDTHRHIFGPKLRQKFVENIGFDDSKPLPQANAGEMFFYRESVDVDYSMEIQRQSGVTSCVNSYGGEVETFAQHVIKASTVDTLKFLHDESFELRDRFPDDIACMANAHALEESMRAVIDPLISKKEACCISISTSYGAGPDQIFLDSPKAEWLWEYAQADYLILAIPGTKENENMIDGIVLAGMKKNAVLVNVARGTLVDETALLAAVKSGHLFGAGLDVVKDEPVGEANPLLREPRIFVTPHMAGSTDLMLDGTVKYLGEVLARYRDGLQSEAIVNEPRKPRVPLRKSPN